MEAFGLKPSEWTAISSSLIALCALAFTVAERRRERLGDVRRALQGDRISVMFVAYDVSARGVPSAPWQKAHRRAVISALCLVWVQRSSDRARAVLLSAIKRVAKVHAAEVERVLNTIDSQFDTYVAAVFGSSPGGRDRMARGRRKVEELRRGLRQTREQQQQGARPEIAANILEGTMPTDGSDEAELKRTFDSLTKELDLVEGGIQRAQSAIYTSFGVVLPAVLSIFSFVAKDTTGINQERLVTIFVAVVCISAIWVNNLWIELLRYARYKYVSLMPRLLRAAGRAGEETMQEFSGSRSVRAWLPAVLLNFAILAFLLIAEMGVVRTAALHAICALFVVLAVLAFAAVLLEVRSVEVSVGGAKK